MRGAERTRGQLHLVLGLVSCRRAGEGEASAGSRCWCLVSPVQFGVGCRLRMVRSRERDRRPADQQGACVHIAVSFFACEKVFLSLSDYTSARASSGLPVSPSRCRAAAAPLRVEGSDLPLGTWWPWVGGHSRVPVGCVGVRVSRHRAAEWFSLG